MFILDGHGLNFRLRYQYWELYFQGQNLPNGHETCTSINSDPAVRRCSALATNLEHDETFGQLHVHQKPGIFA